MSSLNPWLKFIFCLIFLAVSWNANAQYKNCDGVICADDDDYVPEKGSEPPAPSFTAITSPFLRDSKLQCISTGIQKFTKNTPAEKWIAFIAAGQMRQSERNNTYGRFLKNDTDRGELLIRIIKQIQAYGFCDGSQMYKISSNKVTAAGKTGPESQHLADYISGNWKLKTDRDDSEALMKDYKSRMTTIFGVNDAGFAALFNTDSWATAQESLRRNFDQFKSNITGPNSPNVASFQNTAAQIYADEMKDCLNNLNRPEPNQDFCESMVRSCNIANGSPRDICAYNGGGSNSATSSHGKVQPKDGNKR